MNSEHPIILLVEDCPVTAMLIERSILNALPHCRLIWARTIADASERAAGFAVDLFLLDIGLPDGNGLDFLWRIATDHPQANAIVMTANPLPEYEMNSAALGVLHFIEKPINVEQLIDFVKRSLFSEQVRPDDASFRATLEHVTPVDIIQLKCLTGSTTTMEFRSGAKAGLIHFRSGEVVHAEAGGRTGAEAVFLIIGWRCGQMSERVDLMSNERTIYCPWHALLMDAAQKMDEGAQVRAGLD